MTETTQSAGWLYLNPDTGLELSEQHPITSGEVPDAEKVREATAEVLANELRCAWLGIMCLEAQVERLTQNLDREIAWRRRLGRQSQDTASPAPEQEGAA